MTTVRSKAHRLVYHSSPGLSVVTKVKKTDFRALSWPGTGDERRSAPSLTYNNNGCGGRYLGGWPSRVTTAWMVSSSTSGNRCRAKREHLQRFYGLLLDSQGQIQNLASTVLHVSYSLDSVLSFSIIFYTLILAPVHFWRSVANLCAAFHSTLQGAGIRLTSQLGRPPVPEVLADATP